MTTAIVILGFDVTHAIFTLTNFRPSKVIVLLALVNGRLDPRSSAAYSALEQIASASDIQIERLEVEVTELFTAITRLKTLIESIMARSNLVIDLGGGLRILVVETLLAYLSTPSDKWENTRLILYIEGTNTYKELTPADIMQILRGRRRVLSHIEKVILNSMNELEEYSLDRIYREAVLKGLDVSRQYIHKVLRKLVKEGYIFKVARGRYIKLRD
ncbi:MAG: hypothetical protein QXY55_06385 [Candidatus Korarchaeota archaeon]